MDEFTVPPELKTLFMKTTLRQRDLEDIRRWLHKNTEKGNWSSIETILPKARVLAAMAIKSDGSQMLHVAVGMGHNDFLKKLLPYISDEKILEERHSDGSTALHIAAIVGNKDGAELLVKRKKVLLRIKDKNNEEPLQKAYSNMHLETIAYLLKATKEGEQTELESSTVGSVDHRDDEIGIRVLVNAITAQKYSLASELMHYFPISAAASEEILLAIAKSFPSDLNYVEALVYRFFYYNCWRMTQREALRFRRHLLKLVFFLSRSFSGEEVIVWRVIYSVLHAVSLMVTLALLIIISPILIVYLSFIFLSPYCWKGAKILAGPPIKHIENKKKIWGEATTFLKLVCDKLDNLISRHDHYAGPILEAACQNAYEVVQEILLRSPKAINSKDKNGYDFIQLAVIHRSEKVYNLIYDIGERKNLYRTIVDSCENNILHLAGRLAPSNVLSQITGATLQLQRELQWREEVKKLVFPTYTTQENIYKQTPDMVFTREHEDLVKKGELWMKTTSESCSITAALIITIVFAAAITVPGGSNQEKGTPLFKKETAFIIFAISDAISLFSSSTALLVFLSILTTRFAEKDFLVSLPRRLFIGLFSLLLSATAMMVAFSATLFLVFCDRKVWMLAPISGLALIPIASFVTLQFPLMMDLVRSTYLPIFGKQMQSDYENELRNMLMEHRIFGILENLNNR
ncbi:uncharacterized protein LOC143585502 [Bidens hawaiensis]|uniref:uncharacterized protein LOC143585502 n=1 Tax=Bidens hawaiensis TaxID=980011 RepID=UPI00404B48CC